MYEMYQKYADDSECDSCNKIVHFTYGMGSNNHDGGDVIAFCIDCLQKNNPLTYVKHVLKGNIDDAAVKKAADLVKEAKEHLSESRLAINVDFCDD